MALRFYPDLPAVVSHAFSGLLLTVVLALTCLPAQAQTAGQLARDIDRLERQVKALQRKVFDGDQDYFSADAGAASTSAQSQAAILVRLDALEETVRSLTGQIEELRFERSEFAAQQDAFMAQTNYRLNALDGAGSNAAGSESEGAVNAAEGRSNPDAQGSLSQTQASFAAAFKSPNGVADANAAGRAGLGEALPPPADLESDVAALTAPEVAPALGPKERFDEAFQMARRDRFDDAEQAFLMFVADYPEHELASNAQYWLGRVYTAKRQTPQAAEAFLDGYRRYPVGNKAPENLLAFASTLRQMEKPNEACTALTMLKSKIAEKAFPNVSERVLQGIDSESSVLACS